MYYSLVGEEKGEREGNVNWLGNVVSNCDGMGTYCLLEETLQRLWKIFH